MTLSADIALRKLRDGNARFAEGRQQPHYSAEERARLSSEQRPWAVVVGCSDSRVPIEVVFDVNPGDLFVVRTAGHVLADAGYASVRYAVEELECELVVVLGHDDCGAVTAAHKGHVPEWLAPITMHIQFSADATLAEAVDEHVLESVEEVRDWLKASGLPGEQPVVVGAAYQLANGKVHWL